MDLDRCLQTCSWTRLWAIGHARGLPVPRQPTKADLRALVRADLAREQALAREIEALAPEALTALRLLALNEGWLPAGDFTRRFGPLRTFKPWRKEEPPKEAPWRDPASLTEVLWYRGLIYAARRPHGGSSRKDGFCLPEEVAALLPPPPAPGRTVPAPADPPPPPALLYNLTLFQAHLELHAPRPRQGRWLTPRQFRPLLDLLWPSGCAIVAADRRARGERATRLLRALHFVAEAACFVTAPPQQPQDRILSVAPIPPGALLPGEVAGDRPRQARHPAQEKAGPDRLLPTPLWHRWLAETPRLQAIALGSVLAGRAAGLARVWRIYRLPGWQAREPLAPLRRLHGSLGRCPAGPWLDLESFLRRLPDYHLDLLPEELEGQDEPHRQLLTGFLAWLGLVQLDRWQAPTCFRLTATGAGLLGAASPDAPPEVQPFRVLDYQDSHLDLAVDAGCPPALLHRLYTCRHAAWAEPGRARLAPATLAGARHNQVSELVRLLDAGLARPLPGEMITSLQHWARPGSRLAIRRVTLLEASDPELLAHLAGKRGIRRHLRRAFGRRAVEIESNSLESLLRKLRRLGLAPDVEVELDAKDRPAASRRWGPEDAGHLLLAARLYNRLPGRASLGRTERLFRPTHYIPDSTLERLAAGLPPRVLETVDQMVEDSLRRMNEAIDGWRSPPPAAADRAGREALAEILALLRRALTEGKAVEIEYYTAGRGDLTRRVVEPLRLEDRAGPQGGDREGVVYLVAYCRLRQAQRVFRVDRIRSARVWSES